MSGTTSSVGIDGRLPARDIPLDPASQAWLRLLDVALDAASDAVWDAIALVPNDAGARPAGAPRLDGVALDPDADAARALVRRLARVAADDGLAAPPWSRLRQLDPRSLIVAAIERPPARLAGLAAQAGIDVDALAALAHIAAIPALTACARRFAGDVPTSWLEGYCPICGAWPSLAEARGLERSRHLRCGCCGTDWPFAPLRCVFCREDDHEQLGSLLVDGEGLARRIETCGRCHGYLKTVTTLGALPFRTLAVEDLSTVALDLVARERGFARPERPGCSVTVSLRDAAPAPNVFSRWLR